jgi:TldD protein
MNPLRSVIAASLLASCMLAPHIALAQASRADAEKDPVLKAMLEELDRSTSQLQLKGFEKPFFIQYRISEVNSFDTRASFGATEGSGHGHTRVARVTVLVGDYKTDSSGARGDGIIELTTVDNDPIALRSSLWSLTDQAYKAALAAYAQKQAELKQVETPPQADDFSREKPVVSLAAPLSLDVDEAAWTTRVARVSGLYRTDATVKAFEHDIQYSSASLRGRATTTRIVNSEGTIVRKSFTIYQESFGVGLQASDGMKLERSRATTGSTTKDLESEDIFNKSAINLIASLDDLRKAPLVEEEYHGPVLLSSDASADTMRRLLGPGVVATRPRLGTEARTNGPFSGSYHARVLPDSFSVIDDPGLKTFNNVGLVGAYDIDEEGVPAQSVNLITDGKLENYLIGRAPVRDFPQSNGHGRAGASGAPRPGLGVLKITAKDGLSDEELNTKLLGLAKDRGLKSVYYVKTLGGLSPRLLYRINADGSRELVRGAHLADLDQRAIRSGIEAAGKDLWVGNYAGDVPETVLAPALLLDDITVRRANEKNDKLPFYPPPD